MRPMGGGGGGVGGGALNTALFCPSSYREAVRFGVSRYKSSAVRPRRGQPDAMEQRR